MAEVESVQKSIEDILAPLGLEVYPFKIGWYNSKVKESFYLQFHEDSLAFCVISSPSTFEKAFKPYVQTLKMAAPRDPIDECMARQYQCLKEHLPDHKMTIIQDFELHPNRQAKVLVQTAGHVSGGAYYYQRMDMEHDPWGSKNIYGVSIHPKYGGWFAFRGVIIFPEITCPSLPQVQPQKLIDTDAALQDLLEKFNYHWKENTYRDCISGIQERYSDEQITYFQTKPADRWKLLGLQK